MNENTLKKFNAWWDLFTGIVDVLKTPLKTLTERSFEAGYECRKSEEEPEVEITHFCTACGTRMKDNDESFAYCQKCGKNL
jgi:hypothetical protein